MKSNSKKVQDYKRKIEYEKRQKERDDYLNSLSEEELNEFVLKEKQIQKESLRKVSQLFGIL